MLTNLAKLASHLDLKGFRKEADYLDNIIRKMSQEVIPLDDAMFNDPQARSVFENYRTEDYDRPFSGSIDNLKKEVVSPSDHDKLDSMYADLFDRFDADDNSALSKEEFMSGWKAIEDAARDMGLTNDNTKGDFSEFLLHWLEARHDAQLDIKEFEQEEAERAQ